MGTCFRSSGRAVLGAAALSLTVACSGGGGGGGTKGFTVTVTPTSLAFTADRNGVVPPAKTLTVTFDGEVLVYGYPVGVPEPTWLDAWTSSTNASGGTVAVAPNTTGLAPGTYTTTLRFVTGRQDGSGLVYKDVPVQYGVTAGLSASPESISFSAADGVTPDAQSITLSSDVFPRAWTVAVEPSGVGPTDWLGVSAASGTLSTGTATVQVTAAARAPGSYAAFLVVRDGPGTLRARIPVTYTVTPAFTLSGTLAPRVTEAATLASLDLPLTLQTQVDAAAGAGHLWQATASADWLSVVPASGDLAASANLVVRLDPAKLWALPNGARSATVTIASTQGGLTTASVPVTLTVAISPALSAPASLSYAVGVAAVPDDLTRTVTVSSNLGEAFADRGAWHATASDAWLQLTPSAGTGTGTVTLDLVPSALETLANGAHAATVTIAPDDTRVLGATVQASLQLALPDVQHVAPYLTWVGRGEPVVLRGSGFGTGGTLPVLFGADQATGTVVSDTELRVTAPTQATAARVPVSIANTLGLARAASELVVVPAPAYGAHQASFSTLQRNITLDPERQAVLVSGAFGEIRRFAFSNGAWSQATFQYPTATNAYPSLDGKTVLVTSGSTSGTHVFYEVDPATFTSRKQTGYSAGYNQFDLVAGFNDGRILILDSNQWCDTIWYPSLARGLYVSGAGVKLLLTRDRSRMITYGEYDGFESYDVADAAGKARTIGSSPTYRVSWGVSGDGNRLAVETDVYDRDFMFLGSVALPETNLWAVALSPDARLYTLAWNQAQTGWVLRRTDVSGAGPFTPEETPIAATLTANIALREIIMAMAVSEDGGTLFLLTQYSPTVGGDPTTAIFRAIPLN